MTEIQCINDNYKYNNNNLYIWNGTEWRSTPIEIDGKYANLKNHTGLKIRLTKGK